MLNQVLREITQSKEPLSLAALSQKLNIEPGALEGMLTYWVHKRRLRDEDEPLEGAAAGCGGGSCGPTCTGVDQCTFVARMPKTYSLRLDEKALPDREKKQ